MELDFKEVVVWRGLFGGSCSFGESDVVVCIIGIYFSRIRIFGLFKRVYLFVLFFFRSDLVWIISYLIIYIRRFVGIIYRISFLGNKVE